MTDLAAPFRAIENAQRQQITGRFTVYRIDGKGFSKWTRGLDAPYDKAFTDAMTATSRYLAENIPQALCSYVVSDEVSVIVDHGDTPVEGRWYASNIAKLVSLSASMATAAFNSHRVRDEPALFDFRVIPLAEAEQVLAYLDWRRADGVRNAISTAAWVHFGSKAIENASHAAKIDMLASAGHPIDELPDGFIRGRITWREHRQTRIAYQDRRSGEWCETECLRTTWETDDALGSFTDFIGLRPGD